MTDLLHETWDDLRQKRLHLVAVGLVLALLLVPVLLLKRGGDEVSSAKREPPSTAQTQQLRALIPTADLRPGESSLETFKAKDPFEPDVPPLEPIADAGAPERADASSDPGGSGGDPTAGAPPVGGPSGEGGSSGASSPDGGTGDGSGSAPVARSLERVFYTHVLDLRFGRLGSEELYRGVERLRSLPGIHRPLLMYLGVSEDSDHAVFLVHSTLRHVGEGTCKPSPERCMFLSLSLEDNNDAHLFTDTRDNKWRVKLLNIRQVRVEPNRPAEDGADAPKANAGGGAGGRPNLFSTPLLIDEEG